jgi:hypothetical protein
MNCKIYETFIFIFFWKVVALANSRILCCSHYFIIATCILIRIDHLPLGKLSKQLFRPTISGRHHFCLYTYRFDKRKEKMKCERMKRILNIAKERKRLLIKFTSRGKWSNLIKNMLRWRNKVNGNDIANCRLPEQHFLLISMIIQFTDHTFFNKIHFEKCETVLQSCNLRFDHPYPHPQYSMNLT